MSNHTNMSVTNITLDCAKIYKLSNSVYGDILVFALSAIAFIVGVTSWIVIKKFRNFRNYVLLCIIFNNIVNIVINNTNVDCLFGTIDNKQLVATLKIMNYLSFLYFKLATNCWLLVMCHVFYSDLVKVYNNYVTRRYLKANLFAWGLPVLVTVGYVVISLKIIPFKISSSIKAGIFITVLFIPLIINLVLYSRVVYSLMKPPDVNVASTARSARGDRCRSLQMPTLIFFLSGVLMLTMPLRTLIKDQSYLVNITFVILSRLQVLTTSIYFFMVSQNCSVWRDYHRRKSKMRKDVANMRCNKSIAV